MGAVTTPYVDRPPGDGRDGRVVRFDRVERVVHWINATLFLALIATGAVLYLGQLSALVGRRALVRQIHVLSGLALPFPLLFGVLGPDGRRLRHDLSVLNRWSRDDRRWLFGARDDPTIRVGKFNAGQKLNAAFLAGAGIVMLATGSMLKWFEPFPNSWRTGATFVHDWTALAIGLSIIGHVWLALADPDALRGMVRGWVPASWARTHRPGWYAESATESTTSGDG